MTQSFDDGLEPCVRLRHVPVAVTCDVLAAMKLPVTLLAGALRPIQPGVRFAGPAVCIAGREGPAPQSEPNMAFAIDAHVTAGSVVVIATGGHAKGAVIGGNVGASWKRRGCVGVVTDGGIRDASEFAALQLPVFRRFQTPLGNKGLWRFTRAGEPVALPGHLSATVSVQPGDLVHADDDGVVIIPLRHAAEVAHNGELYEAAEQRIQRDIERGDEREIVYARHSRTAHIKPIKS